MSILLWILFALALPALAGWRSGERHWDGFVLFGLIAVATIALRHLQVFDFDGLGMLSALIVFLGIHFWQLQGNRSTNT
ncbi:MULTISPECIES: hypothetical protein [Actinomyces]|uniref:Uncharacterized protein n=1 Tax=Actinomyces glycerinitolerans TaxID=1892869 RepID=A0A1M4RXU2_9ACTO|nr:MULTISPECIES: hypothetical protein [Actinomyces]MBE6475943.1 hypothetical protein [Actinomyces succiniciruminis]RAX21018.1 hypothetical protein DRB07_12430 [Actinomyces sp. Z3]SHE24527.1 Hypothetical protein ACGLYG10_0732 [Actinomyces glycerinitolerans]